MKHGNTLGAMAPRQGLLALSIAAALVSPVAFAQQASTTTAGATAQQGETETQASADAQRLESVMVVGSRIKRTEIEGPAPIVVITREDIEREGFQTVGDMLQTLNQNTNASFTGDLSLIHI